MLPEEMWKSSLRLAAEIPIKPHVQEYALQDANKALLDLKYGHVHGAKVLKIL